MSTTPKPFNICDTLRKRLQEINDKRDATQKKINVSSEQLQKLFSKGGKTSRETPAQLDARIDELETTRTSSSLPLAKEKDILRQIAQIKKAKILYEENKVHEQLIQDKKSEVSALRTELTSVKAQIAELETVLSKVELADRLGCTANDLKSHVLECPASKLGQIIGKGGSNIKKLESKTGCLIDLDKVKSQIHLQGNESSIELAVKEIENITLAIEEEMKLDHAVFHFLFSKHLAEFKELEKNHDGVIFDLQRDTSTLRFRGREEAVALAKEDVNKISVKMETLEIHGREAALIVGKSGKTINRLVEAHDVAIQVENSKKSNSDTSKIIVSGQGNKVDSAMKEIKDILFNSEEIEVSILVSAMTRNKLLTDAGALVKKLQKDVNEACESTNTYIRFEQIGKEERESASILLVKALRMHIEEAEKIVKERIEIYDSAVIMMQVDTDLIPAIIGSKGATIKAIRTKGGPGADIEIDKLTGEVKLLADTDESRQNMKKAVDDIVSENQILRVPMEDSMFPDLFGQSGKAVKAKVQNSGVFIKRNDDDTAVLLRGSIEKITAAAEDIRQFIASNQSIELTCDSADESFLTRHNSLLKKIEKDNDIKLNIYKSRQAVVLRGKTEGIQAAEQELKKILYGGDGYSVEKLFVPNAIVGAIIGKAGKNVLKYESDHESVMVNVHSLTRCLSIRGPSEQVELCKGVIIKDMMECNVNESIVIDVEGFSKLSKPNAISKIVDGLNVTTNLSPKSLRLRGTLSEVQEVKILIKDLLTGVYTAEIMLTPDHFQKVSRAIENPAHFDKIQDATGASISLDKNTGSIVAEGKRSNVKRAKTLIFAFLESIAPSQIAKIKFLKPLLKNLSNPKDIAKFSKETTCVISLERDVSTFLLQATSNQNLQRGVKAIEDKIQACMKLTYVMQVESWLLQHMMTRNENEIKEMKDNSECEIVLSRNELMISITGKEEADVTEAKLKMESIMDQAKKENSFIDLPESSLNEFIGTSGRHMKSIASLNGVHIERVKKTKSSIRIQGSEKSVMNATKVVNDWMSKWEKNNSGVTIAIEDSAMTRLKKESSILDNIQRDFGVKIDVNHLDYTATVRGGKKDSQAKASAKLESFLNQVSEEEKEVINSGNKENQERIPDTTNVSYLDHPVAKVPIAQAPMAEVQPTISQQNPNNTVGKLYNLLVSDDVASTIVAPDVQDWDSSTVSSGLENDIESPETGVSYYRSASGFHVRI